MEIKINELEETYKKQIKTIFTKLREEKYPNSEIEYHGHFGDEITELYQLTNLEEYNDYIKIFNQIEAADPKLAEKLEDYLAKEINLIALLSLHAAIEKLNLT